MTSESLPSASAVPADYFVSAIMSAVAWEVKYFVSAMAWLDIKYPFLVIGPGRTPVSAQLVLWVVWCEDSIKLAWR